MRELPLRFPRDPYCRADVRTMLTVDEAGESVFLGVTPDGAQPGRDMLAKLSLWRGETQLPYTVGQEDGAVVLRCEGGFAALRLGLPDRLTVEAEGVSVLIGKGRALGMFMSGGSAVDDPQPGALYVNAGVRMRILPKRGSVEVRSAWNLNALSDPDPRVFLHPDAQGSLSAAVYVTDFDAVPEEAPTPEAPEAFEAFLQTLAVQVRSDAAYHAAYVVWSCRQPARKLAAAQIASPLYISNRRTLGTAMLSDNVLLAALLSDPAEAARQLCAFLPYAGANGLLPRAADNRSRLYEAETPYFGVVARARPDILAALGAEEYEGLRRALGWWQRERFCPERGKFFYLHRYEPGFGGKGEFASPDFSPVLNACMRFWLEAMARLAEDLDRPGEAEAYLAQAAGLEEALSAGERIPAALELPLLLAGDDKAKAAAAAQAMRAPDAVLSLRRALTVLAAEAFERGALHAD